MLSEREIRRLQEIERQLRSSDPRLVRRFAVLHAVCPRPRRAADGPGIPRSVHGAGPVPTALLGLALVVLLIGALAVSVPVVIGGVVLAALGLGIAAAAAPPGRPGFA